jgi:hypothetical protein
MSELASNWSAMAVRMETVSVSQLYCCFWLSPSPLCNWHVLTFLLDAVGSISLLDSSFNNVKQMLVVRPMTSSLGQGNTGINLERIALSGVGVAVADTSGATLLAASSNIDQWVAGPIYEGSTTSRTFSTGAKIGQYRREHSLLDSQGNYFERAKPQYEDQPPSAFLHTKDLGCRGDGSTDDTAAFQSALYKSVGKILFVDAGTYILTSTVTIPSGVKIVGETWSQLAASGAFFSDARYVNPRFFTLMASFEQSTNLLTTYVM